MSKQSLIETIIAKRVLTPYEAIYLQYLNNEYVNEQEDALWSVNDPYGTHINVPGFLSQHQLQRLTNFSALEEKNEYSGLAWGITLLHKIDKQTVAIGYKGMALLDELGAILEREYADEVSRLAREEAHKMYGKVILGKEENFPRALSSYTTYSHVYQRRTTHTEVFDAFIRTFSFLIEKIDMVLTLNYYLKTMIPEKELHCTKQLILWTGKNADTAQSETDKMIVHILCSHITYYFDTFLEIFLGYTHPHCIEFVKTQLEGFDQRLPLHFQEDSLRYIQSCFATLNPQERFSIPQPSANDAGVPSTLHPHTRTGQIALLSILVRASP